MRDFQSRWSFIQRYQSKNKCSRFKQITLLVHMSSQKARKFWLKRFWSFLDRAIPSPFPSDFPLSSFALVVRNKRKQQKIFFPCVIVARLCHPRISRRVVGKKPTLPSNFETDNRSSFTHHHRPTNHRTHIKAHEDAKLTPNIPCNLPKITAKPFSH